MRRHSPFTSREINSCNAYSIGERKHRLTTVFLSATNRDNCPSFTFYVLEVIVNSAMIVEVSIRFFAFGNVSPLS